MEKNIEKNKEKSKAENQEYGLTESGLFKIIVNKNLKFEYGGVLYELKRGKIYEVSSDLRELLKRGGHLEVY